MSKRIFTGLGTMSLLVEPAGKSLSSETLVSSRVLNQPKETDQGFRELVAKHQNLILRMFLRQTSDISLARDLSQETFLKAYKNFNSFRGDSSFNTWLTRIALNTAKNYFKSRSFKEKRRTVPLESDPQAEQSEDAITENRLLRMRELVGELKPIYRDVLVLCALEKKSYDEAAEILGIPVGTVRSRLNTARIQLKSALFREEGR